jgi:uncharacterized protein YbbC (DUF1343 family)
MFGAPFIDPDKIMDAINPKFLKGAILRPLEFEPTANKWQEQRCSGFQIHVTDRQKIRPYRLTLALLQAVVRCHPDFFQWKLPPYEYEFEKCPIDLIIGSRKIRKELEDGIPIGELEERWQDVLDDFISMAKKYYLYE